MAEALDQKLKAAKRNQTDLAVVMMDIDHFKKYTMSKGRNQVVAAAPPLERAN